MRLLVAAVLLAAACDSNGGFSEVVPYGARGGGEIAAAADFNDDGFTDFVAPYTTPDPLRAQAYVFQGSLDRYDYDVVANPPTLVFPRLIQIGDWNGDRSPDLAIACEDPAMAPAGLSVTIAEDHHIFQTANAALPGVVDGIAAADFNEDGADDLAFSWTRVDASSGDITAGVDIRFGPYMSQGSSYGGASEIVRAAGDVNNDGHVDVVTSIGVRPGDGSGQLGDSVALAQTNDAAVVADLDGDGLQDLVTTSPDGLQVFRGDATGGLTPDASVSFAGCGHLTLAPMPAIHDRPAIIACDAAGALVFANLGDGELGGPVHVAMPHQVFGTGDFDGDTWTDLLVETGPDTVGIMYGVPRD